MTSAITNIRAAVAIAPGVTEMRDFKPPEISSTSGILQIEATGVCGSDWGYYQNLPKSKGPLILGHDTVGHIACAGVEALSRWGLKEGDLVALEEYIPCGHCEYCRSGDFRHCLATDWRLGGLRYGSSELTRAPGLWGGFATHQYLHPNTVPHKVPTGLDPKYAALALPVSNGVEWTIFQGGAKPGDVVLIQGPGQQGLSCVVSAKQAGASQVIVTGLSTEQDQRRLALAKELGADHVIDIEAEDQLEALARITGRHMADLVIDCAGAVSSLNSAFDSVRKRGRVIMSGQLRKPVANFDTDRIIAKFLTVKGMRGHSFESVELALQMIADNARNIRKMSTHLFALEETDKAIRTMHGEGEPSIHCVVTPV